jgi:hypothetical protein
MPIFASIVIVAVVVWLAVASRRPSEGFVRSRTAHPSGVQSSSVHVLHLGEPTER